MAKRFNLLSVIIGILILGVFGVLVSRYGFNMQGLGRTTIVVKGEKFLVEIADTPLEQNKGLSGRIDLRPNEGLIFLFKKPDYQGFWMKDMLIPIDIIWIKDKIIVGFEEKVEPTPGVEQAKLTVYHPPEPVNKVLEVSAGTVERLGIKVGDEVSVGL